MKINIIGTGISGLLIAYHLIKQTHDITINFFEQQSEHAENASTYSLAWLNALYPSHDHCSTLKGDKAQLEYDIFRINSLKAWHTLLNEFKKDGINHILTSEQQSIKIDSQAIQSLSIFMNTAQEQTFLKLSQRLLPLSKSYKAELVCRKKLSSAFPFIQQLPLDANIYNIEDEQLLNPKKLRLELIRFLKKSGVNFQWNAFITSEMIDSHPHNQWILAAGDGCRALLKNSSLSKNTFCKKSIADVIECQLDKPLNLRGKVFYFAGFDQIPPFHLRNDEENPHRLKIVVASQQGKSKHLEKDALAIFQLLHVTVSEVQCINYLIRPLTIDGKPLVEMQLGQHKNMHVVYGHSLFTSGALLYKAFSKKLLQLYKKDSSDDFQLDQFNADRFSLNQKTFASFSVFNTNTVKTKIEKPELKCSIKSKL